MSIREAYVFEAVRTPRGHGGPKGALASVRPVELVGGLLKALEARGLDPKKVNDLILGCVTQVGDQGANIARVASLYAGWPDEVPGMTVTRFCSSGLDAIGLAAARVIAGFDDCIVAGGVESMSRVPMLADQGAWFKDPEVAKKTGFLHMGLSADLIANLDDKSREALDQWALRSHVRAAAAWEAGSFDRSVVPVTRDGEVLLARDERIKPDITLAQLAEKKPAMLGVPGEEVALAKYPQLKELKRLHSSATAPAVVDGAALLVVADFTTGVDMGLRPLAKIRSYATAAVEPVVMLTAPAPATRRALARAHLELGEVDLFEVNESFSATVLRYIDELGIDEFRVNVHGGAIAMGHPLGASGAILASTLIDNLHESDDRIGVAALCAGAGLGAAAVFERM